MEDKILELFIKNFDKFSEKMEIFNVRFDDINNGLDCINNEITVVKEKIKDVGFNIKEIHEKIYNPENGIIVKIENIEKIKRAWNKIGWFLGTTIFSAGIMVLIKILF